MRLSVKVPRRQGTEAAREGGGEVVEAHGLAQPEKS
jgi:hypothetical protein